MHSQITSYTESISTMGEADKIENAHKDGKDEGEPKHSQFLQQTEGPFLLFQLFSRSLCQPWIKLRQFHDLFILQVHIVLILVQDSMEENFGQGDEETKDEPNVDHLDIRCSWHRVENADEESREYQEQSNIHCDDSVKV